MCRRSGETGLGLELDWVVSLGIASSETIPSGGFELVGICGAWVWGTLRILGLELSGIGGACDGEKKKRMRRLA